MGRSYLCYADGEYSEVSGLGDQLPQQFQSFFFASSPVSRVYSRDVYPPRRLKLVINPSSTGSPQTGDNRKSWRLPVGAGPALVPPTAVITAT